MKICTPPPCTPLAKAREGGALPPSGSIPDICKGKHFEGFYCSREHVLVWAVQICFSNLNIRMHIIYEHSIHFVNWRGKVTSLHFPLGTITVANSHNIFSPRGLVANIISLIKLDNCSNCFIR